MEKYHSSVMFESRLMFAIHSPKDPTMPLKTQITSGTLQQSAVFTHFQF